MQTKKPKDKKLSFEVWEGIFREAMEKANKLQVDEPPLVWPGDLAKKLREKVVKEKT